MELNSFEKSLDRSSTLVKRWGALAPGGEPGIRELLTVGGLSMWDVMAAELALYLIPDGLADRSGRRTLRQVLTPYLRPLKYAFWKSAPVDTGDCSRWPPGKTALFLGFTPYLARDVLQPVIDLLLREPGLTPVLLTALPGGGTAPAHSVHRHRSIACVGEAREFARAMRRASAILTGKDRYRRLFADEGRPLWPLVEHGVRRAFEVSASRILPDAAAVARHILTVHRPAVIVSIDVADPRTRIYTLLGAALGIPTVQVQSGGDIGRECVEWRFFLDDVVAAQGDSSRDMLLSHGVPAEKTRVTGSPRHDGLVGASAHLTGEFRRRFGVPPENRTVVFASSYFLEIFENNLAETGSLLRAMKKAMFAAVAAVPGVSLIVKPHPLENVAETRALVGDPSRVAFAEPGEDIRPLACACDAFFTMGSTATLDALVLGKPTVCPAFPGWVISDAFVRTGAVAVPRSERDIVDILREIAADGGAAILRRHAAKRSEYLSKVVRDGGQGATRRIADLLAELAQAGAHGRKTVPAPSIAGRAPVSPA